MFKSQTTMLTQHRKSPDCLACTSAVLNPETKGTVKITLNSVLKANFQGGANMIRK